MHTYLILRRSAWATADELEKAASRASRVAAQEMPDRLRWIRSYVTRDADGRLGTVCIHEAVDPEAVREHARRARIPADEIIPVVETIVLNDDPVPAA